MLANTTEDNMNIVKSELEDVNNELTQAMLTPERIIHIPHHSWWSDTIKNAHLVVQYWKTRVILSKQPQQDELILNNILEKFGPGVDVNQEKPNSLPTSQLQYAIKYRKQCRNNSFKLRQEWGSWRD
eukprot:15203926-Ditylum_brightwellii.AAC.1